MFGSFVLTYLIKLNFKSSLVTTSIIWLAISLISLAHQGWLIQFEALSIIAFPAGAFCALGSLLLTKALYLDSAQKNI